MKKILVIAALFLTTGIISSCSKDNSVTPSSKTSSDVILSTGDGRPTPPSNSNGGH